MIFYIIYVYLSFFLHPLYLRAQTIQANDVPLISPFWWCTRIRFPMFLAISLPEYIYGGRQSRFYLRSLSKIMLKDRLRSYLSKLSLLFEPPYRSSFSPLNLPIEALSPLRTSLLPHSSNQLPSTDICPVSDGSMLPKTFILALGIVFLGAAAAIPSLPSEFHSCILEPELIIKRTQTPLMVRLVPRKSSAKGMIVSTS